MERELFVFSPRRNYRPYRIVSYMHVSTRIVVSFAIGLDLI